MFVIEFVTQTRMQSAHIMKPAILSAGTVMKHTGPKQQNNQTQPKYLDVGKLENKSLAILNFDSVLRNWQIRLGYGSNTGCHFKTI